jgi:hypothetical protein
VVGGVRVWSEMRPAHPARGYPVRVMSELRTTWFRVLFALGAILVVWTLGAPSVAAKKKVISRTVTGMVLDETDNPIAGAVVEMTDLQTGKKLAVFTKEDGHYQFADLDGHRDYRLQASYRGISSEVRTASSFDDSNRIILNFKISPPKP